jgi:hypothetical protein
MDNCVHLSDEFDAICVNPACPARADACPCLNYQQICKYYEPSVKANIFDEREVHENCTVEIWKNSATGEISIGWYENGNTETE